MQNRLQWQDLKSVTSQKSNYTCSLLRISIPGTVDIELYGTEHLLDKSLICDWTRFKCVVNTVTVVEIWRPALF